VQLKARKKLITLSTDTKLLNNYHYHIYCPTVTEKHRNHKNINTTGRLPEKNRTHWLC